MSLYTGTCIIIGFFTLGGVISLSAAIFNYDWFFDSPSVKMLIYKLPRTAARWLYGVLGIAILALAVHLFLSL